MSASIFIITPNHLVAGNTWWKWFTLVRDRLPPYLQDGPANQLLDGVPIELSEADATRMREWAAAEGTGWPRLGPYPLAFKKRRGRPKAEKDLWTVHLRANEGDQAAVKAAAKAAGVSINEFIIRAALEVAGR